MLADFDAQPGRETPPTPELSSTQREADEAELYAGLRGLAGIVAGARGVIDLLRDVAEFAVQAIPGADGVSVALIDAAARHIQRPDLGGDSGACPRDRHSSVRRTERGSMHHLHAVAPTHSERIAGQ